jgi:hypothetical protein
VYLFKIKFRIFSNNPLAFFGDKELKLKYESQDSSPLWKSLERSNIVFPVEVLLPVNYLTEPFFTDIFANEVFTTMENRVLLRIIIRG